MKKGIAIGLLLIWCIVLYFNLEHAETLVSFTTVVLGIAVALLVIPWENLVHFKAGGLELSVEKNYKSAVEGYENSKTSELMDILSDYKDTLPVLNGARIFWIEDRPANVLGERRILRALGINIRMLTPDVTNPRPIFDSVKSDNDYDLIISDIQWRDEAGNPTYGGLEVIRTIRDADIDANMKRLPVIFYTAYSKAQLETIKQQTNLPFYENMYFCDGVENLVDRVSRLLIEYRTRPLRVGKKGAT